MIINNTFGFIFVHIPKAAGTTLTSVLSRHSSYCDIEVGGTALGEAVQPFFLKRHGLAKHSTIREIRGVVGDVLLKRYFSFAFVRNPYTRAYSAYRFLARSWAEKHIEALSVFERFRSFPDFVRSKYFQTAGLDRILMPQIFWLSRENHGETVAVDYVGTVERLGECLAEIRATVGGGMQKAAPDEVIPVLNRSSESDDAVWLELEQDAEIEQILYRKYEPDFRAFKYPRVLDPVPSEAGAQASGA